MDFTLIIENLYLIVNRALNKPHLIYNFSYLPLDFQIHVR